MTQSMVVPSFSGDAAETRYWELLESLGLAVYTTDSEGHILHYNEEAASLWGRKPEIGEDLWCGSWRIFTPDGEALPLDKCPMAIALKEGKPVRDVEIVVERPDGGRSCVLPYPTPLRDEAGRLIGAVNILLDISERKQAEVATSRLVAIVESAEDAIVGKNLDGIITSWNKAAERIFRYSAEEAIGQSIRLIIPSDRQHEEDEVLARVRKGLSVEHYETVRRRKDGTLVDISLTVSPVKDSHGRVIGASKIARDISDQRAAEGALRRSQAIKDQFLSLVSHELRTPISTILGNGQILLSREERLSREDKRQALADIVSDAKKLKENIDHLLILSRLEASEIEMEPLSLFALVSQGIEAFKERHPARSVLFECNEHIPPVLGQETLVSLVLQNFLSNAEKYSEPETEIEITLSLGQVDRPEVRVRDRGIGIGYQDMANLFTPFYRSAKAKDQAPGMGLGLAVCKRALEVQNGSIGAQVRDGGGSDFYFSLPLAQPSSG
jgi:PAS domain S-box-containing protein